MANNRKKYEVLEGSVAAPNAKVAVAIARFNSFINESLLEGAIDALKRIGQVKDEISLSCVLLVRMSCH